MPISKKDCPECLTRVVTFNPRAKEVIAEEKKKYLAKGQRRNFEQLVNKIIIEWNAWSEYQKTKE